MWQGGLEPVTYTKKEIHKIINESSGIVTHHLSVRFKEKLKENEKGEAFGNRTHNL